MIPAIWTAMYAEVPLPDALCTLHACGWRAFEISTEHMVAIETGPDQAGLIDQTRSCLDSLGLSAPQAHAYLGANVADPDEQGRERDIRRLHAHLDVAARLGVQHVVMHPGGGRHSTQADRKRIKKLNVEAFRRLGDSAGELGVRICLENMPHVGASTPSDLIELLESIDHPAISIVVDTSHAHMCGLDVAGVVRELGPYLAATHISDNDGSGDQHLTPGGGTIDWPAVMDAFRDAGYSGLFNLEIPGERHPVPELRRLKTRFALDVANWLVG